MFYYAYTIILSQHRTCKYSCTNIYTSLQLCWYETWEWCWLHEFWWCWWFMLLDKDHLSVNSPASAVAVGSGLHESSHSCKPIQPLNSATQKTYR